MKHRNNNTNNNNKHIIRIIKQKIVRKQIIRITQTIIRKQLIKSNNKNNNT